MAAAASSRIIACSPEDLWTNNLWPRDPASSVGASLRLRPTVLVFTRSRDWTGSTGMTLLCSIFSLSSGGTSKTHKRTLDSNVPSLKMANFQRARTKIKLFLAIFRQSLKTYLFNNSDWLRFILRLHYTLFSTVPSPHTLTLQFLYS